MTDNAALQLMLKSSTAEIEATCGYQWWYKYFPTLREHNMMFKSLVCMMHEDWSLYLAGKCFRHCNEICIVFVTHAFNLYTGKFVRENPSFMVINVNHADNSSANYHQDRKQPCALAKQTVSWENPTRVDGGWHLYVRTQNLKPESWKRGQEKEKSLEGYTTWTVLHKRQAARREYVVALFEYQSDKNNRVFFFSNPV